MSQVGCCNKGGGGGGGGGGQSIIITKFTSNGTWTKNPNTTWMTVIGWGGGSGGGSGASIDFTGSDILGATGGANDGSIYYSVPAQVFSASEPVIIGAGGVGGASVVGGDGNPGSPGGATSIGNISTCGNAMFSTFTSGNNVVTFGIGGTTLNFQTFASCGPLITESYVNYSTGTSGTGHADSGSVSNNKSGSNVPPFVPGFSGAPGQATGFGSVNAPCGTCGGGGGQIDGGGAVAHDGGAGGSFLKFTDLSVILAGGTAGTVGVGQNGGNGINAPGSFTHGSFYGGTGGGGGASNLTGPGGSGGNGAIPGGGGGGGGSCPAAFASGKGGNGARGELWVIEFLTNTGSIVGSTTTFDGAFHTIATIPVPLGQTITLFGNIVGRNNPDTDSTGGNFTATISNPAAVATIIGVPFINKNATTTGSFQVAVNAGNALIQVQGIAATTYNWTVSYGFDTA